MERIPTKDNINQAYRQVVENKGKYGKDGIMVDKLTLPEKKWKPIP